MVVVVVLVCIWFGVVVGVVVVVDSQRHRVTADHSTCYVQRCFRVLLRPHQHNQYVPKGWVARRDDVEGEKRGSAWGRRSSTRTST